MSTTMKVKYGIRFPVTLYKKAVSRARLEERSLSEVIRLLLKMWLEDKADV